MWRVGRMENGLCQGYSYGKSGVARFLDGGFKMGSTLNLGGGNAIAMGVGYETRAPQANVAFESPELNNNFVKNLKNEKVFTADHEQLSENLEPDASQPASESNVQVRLAHWSLPDILPSASPR